MAQCAAVVNVNGQALFAPVDTGDAPCTSLLLLTPAEYGVVSGSPFNMTAEDGLVLSVAIVGVWAVAFSWHAIRRALGSTGGESETP